MKKNEKKKKIKKKKRKERKEKEINDFIQQMQYNSQNKSHVHFSKLFLGSHPRTPLFVCDPEPAPLPFKILAASVLRKHIKF